MDQEWLTVRLVEQLQELVEDGREIASILTRLRGATLPGLMEYGCLKHSSRTLLTPLPSSIVSSTIGRALNAVDSVLGTRNDGTAHPQPRRIDVRPAEFYVVRTEDDLLDENWKTFTIRFARSAHDVGLTKTVSDGMRGALHEMAE